MKVIHITGSAKTPTLSFDPSQGTLQIKGRCIPEDPIEFFRPLNEALSEYLQSGPSRIVVTIDLEYFNTSSSKCLLDIFRKLEPVHQAGKSEVTVLWNYEEDDEDMMEAGEDYKTIVKLLFEITKI